MAAAAVIVTKRFRIRPFFIFTPSVKGSIPRAPIGEMGLPRVPIVPERELRRSSDLAFVISCFEVPDGERKVDTRLPGNETVVIQLLAAKLQCRLSDIEFDDRGEHELKGVPGSWKLFAVGG
jgi:hypothetical protein